jgi:hypothetical protein
MNVAYHQHKLLYLLQVLRLEQPSLERLPAVLVQEYVQH